MDSPTRTLHQNTAAPQVFSPLRRLGAIICMHAAFLTSGILLEFLLTHEKLIGQATILAVAPVTSLQTNIALVIGAAIVTVGILAFFVPKLPRDTP